MSTMTLNDVRRLLASWYGGSEACLDIRMCDEILGPMIAAIDAHLAAQPAEQPKGVTTLEPVGGVCSCGDPECMHFAQPKPEQDDGVHVAYMMGRHEPKEKLGQSAHDKALASILAHAAELNERDKQAAMARWQAEYNQLMARRPEQAVGDGVEFVCYHDDFRVLQKAVATPAESDDWYKGHDVGYQAGLVDGRKSIIATPAEVTDELVERFKVAARALVRERKVYGEDVETMHDVLRVLEAAALASPRAGAVVPEGQRKLIGWRMADYTAETSDPEKAKNWSSNVTVLPIFEGDPNTKLAAAPEVPSHG